MSFPHETNASTHSSTLDDSWASVAASAPEKTQSNDDTPSNDSEFPSLRQVTEKDNVKASTSQGVGDLLEKKNDRDGKDIKSTQEADTPYAEKAKKAAPLYTDQEYPSPQKAAQEKLNESVPSQGVSDLLNQNKDRKVQDPTIPPHPERSFATVAGNKDFPGLEITADASPASATSGEGESLSSIPDVKDMLGASSVKVPPPPPSKSFAKIAAKGDAEEKERTPAPRTVELRKQNDEAQKLQESSTPADKTYEDFPTLSLSNLMAGQGASPEAKQDRALLTEISKLSEAADATEYKRGSPASAAASSPSFAHVTKSNLDSAPPSISPKPVDAHPVYDEETMLADSARREMRKLEKKPGILEPEMEKMEEKKETIERKVEHEVERKDEGKPTASEGSVVVKRRLEHFDRRNKGKFTVLDTLLSLHQLGYRWFTAIPIAILVHLRLSPLTSPYGFPFIYRNPIDLIRLPIYTDRVRRALAYRAPLVGRPEVAERFGQTSNGVRGLGFWGGVRALKYHEALRWWQVVPWTVHRLQWLVTYTMLQDPKTHLVADSALVSLANEADA